MYEIYIPTDDNFELLIVIKFLQPLGSYSVSKTTLLGLTKAIANEVVTDNIRVNCVAPGIVATKFASAVSIKFLTICLWTAILDTI